MSDRDRVRHRPGETIARGVCVIASIGGTLLAIALMVAFDRWMIG